MVQEVDIPAIASGVFTDPPLKVIRFGRRGEKFLISRDYISISSHSTGWSKLKTSSQKQTNLGNSSQGKDRKAGLTQLTLVCHSCVDPTNERVS
ncbi:hypothetical protein RRG08_053482 [Elysia crispata]|uniref:Uncharacterized protein n=1 Tax=Elysia crispata TaxID=231223 RepID=A0AAE1A0L3_9GAST|nr:hypothetical protein RRG08_053482 [Elysia crispata]